MKQQLVALLLVGTILLSPFPVAYGQQQAPVLDEHAQRAMLVLNYCHFALAKILASEDRIILDEEYNTIINNIQLSAIHDEELITVLQQLMDVLTLFRLTDQEKAFITEEYNSTVSKALYATYTQNIRDVLQMYGIRRAMNQILTPEAKNIGENAVEGMLDWGFTGFTFGKLPGGLLGGMLGGLIRIGKTLLQGPPKEPIGTSILMLYLVSKIGDVYQHYRQNMPEYRYKLKSALWELDKAKIEAINDVRKVFLKTYWDLMNTYNIPERWRLTEQQLNYFLTVINEQDPAVRFRQLKAMQANFEMFPPFWYLLAKTAQEVNDYREALVVYHKIDTLRLPIFREDREFAQAMMEKVLLLRELRLQQPDLLTLLADLDLNVDLATHLRTITREGQYEWTKNLFAAQQYAELGLYDEARALAVRNIDHDQEVSLSSRVLGDIYAASHDDTLLQQLIAQMSTDPRIDYHDIVYLIGKVHDTKILQDTIARWLQPAIAGIDIRIVSKFLVKDALDIILPGTWMNGTPDKFQVQLISWDQQTSFFPDTNVESHVEAHTFRFHFKDVLEEEEFIKQGAKEMMLLKLSHDSTATYFRIDSVIYHTSKKETIEFTVQEVLTSSGECYGVTENGLQKLATCSLQSRL